MKNFLSLVCLVSISCVAFLPSAHAWEAKGDYGTVTAASGAATLNKSAGLVTSESITTAAGATYTLTLTNSKVTSASSIVSAAVDPGSSAGTPCVTTIVPSAGSVVIKVQNVHASAAFNNAIKIRFWIIKP